MLLGLGRAVVQPPETVEAHGAAQRVAALALVQLRRRLPAELGLLQPVQGVQGSLDAPDLAQRERQPVLPRVGAEALEHQRGADRARAHRGRQPEHVVPLRRDQLFVGSSGDERRQRRPGRGRTEGVELAVGEVGDARGEAEAQEMRQGEHVVTHPAAVRVMDSYAEVRLVVEQAVDDVSRLARGRNRSVWYGACRDETWV